jgi:L-aspartate oxidase
VVFAARIASSIAAQPQGNVEPNSLVASDTILIGDDELRMTLREAMSAHVGVLRNSDGIRLALRTIQHVRKAAQTLNLQNMAVTAQMIATAALNRRESRGGHYRTDYPAAIQALAKRTMSTLAESDATAEAATEGME